MTFSYSRTYFNMKKVFFSQMKRNAGFLQTHLIIYFFDLICLLIFCIVLCQWCCIFMVKFNQLETMIILQIGLISAGRKFRCDLIHHF